MHSLIQLLLLVCSVGWCVALDDVVASAVMGSESANDNPTPSVHAVTPTPLGDGPDSTAGPAPTNVALLATPEYDTNGLILPQHAPGGVVLFDTNPPVIPPSPPLVYTDISSPQVYTLASKLDELLAMSDDDLAKVPTDTSLALTEAYLTLARLKDRTLSSSATSNQTHAVRAFLETVRKEHTALLQQGWTEPEKQERIALEQTLLSSLQRAESMGSDETQEDIAPGTMTSWTHSLGYIAIIVVGSVAAAFLIFAIAMYFRNIRQSTPSEHNTYELHQSLNGNV